MARDTLHDAFLAELEALETFRITYTGLYPGTPLSQEDPDVRRLIEAMAMFAARTRLAAERGVRQSLLAAFRQHFPYLLGPVPATAMLRADIDSRFADAADLPQGAEIYLSRRNTKDAQQVFHLRTLAPLHILPIRLAGGHLLRSPGGAYRLALQFEADFARNDEIGELSVHINHLDDLLSSLRVTAALEEHCRSASVAFDPDLSAETPGKPCDIRFGPLAPPDHAMGLVDHPLARARLAIHAPRHDLYLHVRVSRQPRNWRRFTISLDLGDRWPSDLRLTTESFALHVVPMLNLVRATADPIEYDGTRERCALVHPDAASGFVPHSVAGVYRRTKAGLVPLEPAVLGATAERYDVLWEGRGLDRRAFIALHLPGAFERPERIMVEALWHQPSLACIPATNLDVRLANRYLEGVRWTCSGSVTPPAESALEDDAEALLRILSLKNQRILDIDDLRDLLRAFGVPEERHLARLFIALSRVELTVRPFGQRSSGIKHTYALTFEGLDPMDLPQLGLLCEELLDILAAWSLDEVVELIARVPGLGRELHYS